MILSKLQYWYYYLRELATSSFKVALGTILMMESKSSSSMQVFIYRSIWHHILEIWNLHHNGMRNSQSNTAFIFTVPKSSFQNILPLLVPIYALVSSQVVSFQPGCVHFFLIFYVCATCPHPSHISRTDHSIKWWKVWIMKIFITQFSSAS